MRFLLFLFLTCLVPACLQADEWWAWSTLEFIHEPPWTAGLFLGHRFDDADAFTSLIISPRVRYELTPWLDAGLGLSLLNIANTHTSEHHLQGRPELELNPKFNLTKHLRLDLRNRLEWRMNEDQSLTTSRARHRVQLAWTFPHSLGPWSRVFISNEFLIDLHSEVWTENRCVPLGFTFKTGPRSDLDLFYMILSTRRPHADWLYESVLGTYLRVKF